MTKIIGLEDIQTSGHLQQELQQGGKFVMYQYCISLLIITFRRSSNIYFIRHEDNAVVKGLPFTLLSLVLGWWGIPWGPIYTIQSIWVNFSGGKDVTQEVLASMADASQKTS
ncbi:MAG: hypothetical protein L0287_18540 [Anaerolineae bacterium]|nr:hypothetical protein [Anaerolineae bacterium]MCI0608077.1 hypothetical protein [Anaerolineae bacterium]